MDQFTAATAEDLLLAYSEWLDAQGVIQPDVETENRTIVVDNRSHAQLVADFIAEKGDKTDG